MREGCVSWGQGSSLYEGGPVVQRVRGLGESEKGQELVSCLGMIPPSSLTLDLSNLLFFLIFSWLEKNLAGRIFRLKN
jgi:hypothetical protein